MELINQFLQIHDVSKYLSGNFILQPKTFKGNEQETNVNY